MQLANMNVGNGQPLFVIAGPCVIESESMIMNTAQTLKNGESTSHWTNF